jgi:hypothetical protein
MFSAWQGLKPHKAHSLKNLKILPNLDSFQLTRLGLAKAPNRAYNSASHGSKTSRLLPENI